MSPPRRRGPGGTCAPAGVPRWIPSEELCQGANQEHQSRAPYRGGTTSWQPISGGDDMSTERSIDWATRLEGDGAVVAERQVAHSGAGIADLCACCTSYPAGTRSAARLPHGAVVELLAGGAGCTRSIPSRWIDFVCGSLTGRLLRDRRSFRQLQVQAPPVIELREWSRLTAELQEERNGLINRMREQLRRYYPQMIELGGEFWSCGRRLRRRRRQPGPEGRSRPSCSRRPHSCWLTAILTESRR